MADTRVLVELRHPAARMPRKAHPSDACFDLTSPEAHTIPPGATATIDVGLALQLEEGWEAQVRGRSGLASRGHVVHPGTVDHLYRHNLKVVVHNLSQDPWVVRPGDRIAQMKISRVWEVQMEQAAVQTTGRGGLGSTGR
ncbi:MAG TPA: dUTP diphosphatase [Candidatus Nitrosotenuis sp.]|jgi:dUTP pyrophosphatase|nr:dUTP diphosphatase [Candidatus Nitrosotenuis sp.]